MLALETTQAVPLVSDEQGTIRFHGSRVTLDTILGRYLSGESAEQIHEGFPSLGLSEIYGAITYYLSHKDQVDLYLRERKTAAADTRSKIEELPGSQDLREFVRQTLNRS